MGTAQVDRRSSSSSSVWYDRNFKASDNFKDSDNFETLTEDHETLALDRKIVDNRKKNQKEDHRDNYYKNNNHKDYYDRKRRSADRESGEISEDDDEEVSDSRKRRKSPKDGNNYNGNSHQINGKPTIASSRWADAQNSSPEEPELKKARVSTERSRSGSMSLTPELTNRHGQRSRSSSRSSEQIEKPESISQKEERSSSHSYGSERGEDSDYSSKKIQEISPNEFCDYEEETEEKEEAPDVPTARRFDMLKGCRNVDEFEKLNKINEGTYGIVYRARDKKSGEIVALKKVKMERQREGFPISSLREINILLSLYHPSIVNVKEVVVGSDVDKIFMVMEYMEHDLKGFMEHRKREKFSISEVKCLMLQLLEGVGYLHDNWVLHRDLKTSNLLFNNSGELKICDLGLARQYGSPLKTYTETVVTLWYRSPELLLGAKKYSTAVDVWSIGCIMAELLTNEPLFPGKTEIEQLDKIFKTLGTPSEEIWPGFKSLPGAKVKFVRQPYNRLREKFPGSSLSFYGKPTLTEQGFDLLSRLLTYDPDRRITCEEALNHPWFKEVPLAKAKEFMPTLPPVNDNDRQSRRYQKSPDPLEEKYLKDSRREQFGDKNTSLEVSGCLLQFMHLKDFYQFFWRRVVFTLFAF